MTDKRSLLAVFAHPDDESFGQGGILAKYASEGIEVSLICATRGEAGQISDPSLSTPAQLGDVRTDELRCACQILGVTNLILFDYRDSGMAGSEDNNHPDALAQADLEEVTSQIVEQIRRLRPQVVVTFEPGGGYGHPDHIAVHKATKAAFEAAGDPSRFPEQLAAGLKPYAPLKLYYAAFPRSRFLIIRDKLLEMGIDISRFGEIEVAELGVPDESVTTRIDVSAYLDAKQRAVACHRTQLSADNPFQMIPPDLMREFQKLEHFILAESRVLPLDDIETDLFRGVS